MFNKLNKISTNQRLISSLKEEYGLNRTQCMYILNKFGLKSLTTLSDITHELLAQLQLFIQKKYILKNDLKYKVNSNLRFKKVLNTYKGARLLHHLPINGQNTKSNGKTARKLN